MSLGAIGGLVLIGVGPLPLCWRLLAKDGQSPATARLAHQLLTVALLWSACQLSLATLLAALNSFRLAPALAGEGVLLLLGIVSTQAVWKAGISRLLGPKQAPAVVRTQSQHTPAYRWLLPFTALFVALLLFGNLTSQPITDYDSLYYHLPFSATLYSIGGLTATAAPALVAWYPFGWETLCTLFILPIGTDLVVALPNLVAWFIFGAAIYLLAQRRAARPLAATVALLALTQPLLLNQINTLRVDLALAAFFIAGLYFAQRVQRGATDLSAVFCLLCVGLSAALKSTGLLYGALLVAILLFQWTVARSTGSDTLLSQPPPGARFRRGTIWLITVLTWCSAGYWYGRNWQTYANPFGLLEVKLGSWQLWPGTLPASDFRASTLATLFAPDNLHHWLSLFQQGWEQLALPGLVLAGLVLALLYTLLFFPAQPRAAQGEGWAMLGFMLLLFVLFWFTPFSGDDGTNGWRFTGPWFGQSLRFALPALALLAVCAAWGAARLSLPTRWVTLGGIAASLLSLAQRSTLFLVAVLGFAAFLLLVHWLWQRDQALPRVNVRLTQPRGQLALAVLLCTCCLLALGPLQMVRTHRSLLVYGQLPQVIEELTPPHTPIAALFSHQSYLAAGHHLQRTVVHAPTDFTTPAQLLAWLNQHTIELVVVGPIRPEWQQEPLLRWLTTADSSVELLYSGGPDHPALYRIRQGD